MKFQKKSQMLYQEAIMIVFSLLLISITLYFALNYISGTKATIEKSAPEISYKFSAAFIHGFLYSKISNEDTIKLNLDETKNYYVKDLLYLDSKESREIVLKSKKVYLDKMNKDSFDNGGNMHTYYKEFSKQSYEDEELLFITDSLNVIPTLEENFREKNYFYYIKTHEEKYILIYFLKSSSNSDLSSTPEVLLGEGAP